VSTNTAQIPTETVLPYQHIIFWIVRYPLCFIFNHNKHIRNQQLFEKHLWHQSNHYEIYKQFPLWNKAIVCYHQLTLCAVSNINGTKGVGLSLLCSKFYLYLFWNFLKVSPIISCMHPIIPRNTPIPDTYIGIGNFWWHRISISYSVSIRYHNRYYYDVI